MTIVIPYYHRQNYLRITLATLKEANDFDATQVILFKYSDDNLPPIATGIRVVSMSNPGPTGAHQTAFDYVFSTTDTQYILNLDSDCVVHPCALQRAREMIADLPDMGYGTIFNTGAHRSIPLNEKYCYKESIGGLGSIINKDMWLWYRQNRLPPRGTWDWDVGHKIKNTRWKMYSTVRSYVEHIGHSGTNKYGDGTIDKALNFLN